MTVSFCRLTIKPSKKLQRELRATFEHREFFCETCPEPVEGFAQFAPFALENASIGIARLIWKSPIRESFRILLRWQGETKLGALARFALDPDPAFVHLDNSLHKGKPNPLAIR